MDVSQPPSKKQEAHIGIAEEILKAILNQAPEQQNEMISHILINIKKDRADKVYAAQTTSEELSKSYQGLMEIIKMV